MPSNFGSRVREASLLAGVLLAVDTPCARPVPSAPAARSSSPSHGARTAPARLSGAPPACRQTDLKSHHSAPARQPPLSCLRQHTSVVVFVGSSTLYCQFDYRRCCVPRCALAGVSFVVPLHSPLPLVPPSAITTSTPFRHPALVLDKKPKRVATPLFPSNRIVVPPCRCRHLPLHCCWSAIPLSSCSLRLCLYVLAFDHHCNFRSLSEEVELVGRLPGTRLEA